ncbi:MAG: nitrogen fixation protein NifQ [Pseudomonadota bacterium]
MLLSTDLSPPPPRFMPSVSDFACIVDHALSEREAGQRPLTERLGISGRAIASLRDKWLPAVALPDLDRPAPLRPDDQHAIASLILMRAGSRAPEATWLAGILARRSMEPRHLWEDLGLPGRPMLSAMIAHHLPGLAAANRLNMRWKKFFYRQICADSAFSLCLTPTCDACSERDDCFAPADA